MKRRIFVAGVWGAGHSTIMERLAQDADVEFLREDFQYKIQFREVWRVINHKLGGRGGGIIRLLLRTRLFDGKYALSHCDFESSEESDIVIFNSALLNYYSVEYFTRLRKRHPNIKYILYIIDPMPNGLWQQIQDVLPVFDMVCTIHPYNCKRYGFRYLPYAYAKPTEPVQATDIVDTVLFYCGILDDYRVAILDEIVKQCGAHQIDFDFWMRPYKDNPIHSSHVHYRLMPYEENVERLKRAECILEVMHKGYVGITQRYLEAIIYNKRLISNNPEITELPYYDPRFMQYFEKVEDIDWEWLHSDERVDYHYQGDFSVQAWKKKLLDMLDEKL